MYEEPQARELIRRPGDSRFLADDYFISPVDIEQLLGKAKADSVPGKVYGRGSWEDDHKDAKIKILEKLATEDDLTGLKNRRYLREFLKQILIQMK